MATRQIAFYGHRGVGTTTIVVNIAAALAEAGQRVIVVGCDGEPNSTAVLHPRQIVTPLVETILERGNSGRGHVLAGFKGIRTLELGPTSTPESFVTVIGRLHDLLAIEGKNADFILYDITGDVQKIFLPLTREGLFDEVLLVTSAQVSALRNINQLLRFKALDLLPSLRLTGLIGNALQTTYAESVVDDFSRKTKQTMIAYIPRSLEVYRCEFFGETIIEAVPLSHPAYLYRKLANALREGLPELHTQSFSAEEFEDWGRNWGDRLYDLYEGLIEIGSGI